MKCAFALASAVALAAPSLPGGKPYAHDEAAIVQVMCTGGWGTATKIGPSEYVTAAHVIDAGGCMVGGVGITVNRVDRWNDYATFTGPTSNHVIPVSCGDFHAGTVYVGRGFAAGFNANVLVPWLATELTDRGFRIFVSDASIPGMSGGPILDRRGRVTGVISMRVASRALPMRITELC
jgi:hypothetical protein